MIIFIILPIIIFIMNMEYIYNILENKNSKKIIIEFILCVTVVSTCLYLVDKNIDYENILIYTSMIVYIMSEFILFILTSRKRYRYVDN